MGLALVGIDVIISSNKMNNMIVLAHNTIKGEITRILVMALWMFKLDTHGGGVMIFLN